MLNSEKMVASIQKQDLEHADKYFKRALKEWQRFIWISNICVERFNLSYFL